MPAHSYAFDLCGQLSGVRNSDSAQEKFSTMYAMPGIGRKVVLIHHTGLAALSGVSNEFRKFNRCIPVRDVGRSDDRRCNCRVRPTPQHNAEADMNDDAAILGMLLFLSPSLAQADYWTCDLPPQPVEQVKHVQVPCGIWSAKGCWNRSTRTIEIKLGLSKQDEVCVEAHERKHASGCRHPEARVMEFATDCGNGTMWMPPSRG